MYVSPSRTTRRTRRSDSETWDTAMTTIDDTTTTREGSIADRLLRSSQELSYDPLVEVDWDTPLDPAHHGASPEWSTLYGTPYWNELTEPQRAELTRQESASVACTGIWFELVLQQLMLRDMYTADRKSPDFQWALTEIADECRHSIMFARGVDKLNAPAYLPSRRVLELGRFFKTIAWGEAAYAAILVAEEVLDVMQRDWMRDERVAPFVRTINNIHVVEESRHMKFARDEVAERMRHAGPVRRHVSALLVAASAYHIVTSMVSPRAYAEAGLDVARAKREAAGNEHYKSMLRSSCRNLMEFLHGVGLLTPPAAQIYTRANLL
jgi:hypothetical protein